MAQSAFSPVWPLISPAIVTDSTDLPPTHRLQVLEHRRRAGAHELVVRMLAAGVCHTDLVPELGVRGVKVQGHEGAGIVHSVGAGVTAAQPGDPVLLSIASCNTCAYCLSGHPAYCASSVELTILGAEPIYAAADTPVAGFYFGQSSFAGLALVRESSVVNVRGLVHTAAELRLCAPLGCGLMTGSGTLLRVAKAQAEDCVAVLGVGGVGLAAIMAAKMVGCRSIVAIDRMPARLAFAKELGATHVLDTTGLDPEALAEAARAATEGLGPSICIDTTGVLPLVEQALAFSRKRGIVVQVGTTTPDAKLEIGTLMYMVSGKSYVGAIMGDSTPRVHIPQMIEWWRKGQFPFDRLIKFFKADAFEQAFGEMHSGQTIKPVLVWSEEDQEF